jgi:hypothetical protein
VKVNQPDENGVVMNDLSRGKYDVVVTTGPSFATQRQEAAEAFIALAGQDQMLMPTAGDLVYKAMDLPYSEQIAERRQAMLPPPIQEMINSDKPLPPEVQQAMMQVQQQAEQVKQHGMLVQQAQSELQSEKADADKAKSSVEIAMANLKAEEARFEATVAKAEAKLQKLAADLSVQEIQNESDKADAEKVGNAANFAIQQIQAVADGIKSEFGQFLGHAAQVVIAAKEQPPIVLEKPRAVRIRSKRVNGEQVGTIEYDDGTHKQVKASRLNGELVANVQPDAAIAAPESQLTQE